MPVHSPASRGCLLLPDSRPCRTYLAFAAKRTTFPAGKSITGHEPMSTEPERKTRTTYEMQLQDMHLILFNAATSKHLAVSAYLQRLTAPKILHSGSSPWNHPQNFYIHPLHSSFLALPFQLLNTHPLPVNWRPLLGIYQANFTRLQSVVLLFLCVPKAPTGSY